MGASKESAPARLGSLIKWNSIVPFLVSLILMGILWRQMVHWSSPNSPWLSRSVPQSVYATTEALFSGGSSVFPPTRSRAFHCSDAQRFGQAAAWRALFDEKKVLVSCADSIYMGFVREFLQTQSPVLVNVGANKGYGIMHWLLAFDSTFEFSLKDVYNMYEERFPGLPRLCGVCRDCEEAPGRSTSLASNSDTDMTPTLSRKPVIYAFEPAINNSMVLSALEEMIQYPTLEVIHAAASNVTGKLYFTGCAAGQETCHLVMRPMKDALEIDVTTIDEFLRMRKIPKVDILKIDAEGFDPLVLQGAQLSLALRKIRVLEFEYHQIGHWNAFSPDSSSLEEVTAWLDDIGYDCYLESSMKKSMDGVWVQQFDLVRLTGCWDPRLEIRMWSNVACVLREELEISMMFFKASRWLEVYG